VFELGTFCFVHREISELEIAEEGWDLGSDHSSVISVFGVPSYISMRIPVRHLRVALVTRVVENGGNHDCPLLSMQSPSHFYQQRIGIQNP